MPTYQIKAIFAYLTIYKDKHIPKDSNDATYQRNKIKISHIYQGRVKYIHLSLTSCLTV